MESYSRYIVAVIDNRGEVLVSSGTLDTVQSNFLRGHDSQEEYEWVQRDWLSHPYLISQSPIVTGNTDVKGYEYVHPDGTYS